MHFLPNNVWLFRATVTIVNYDFIGAFNNLRRVFWVMLGTLSKNLYFFESDQSK